MRFIDLLVLLGARRSWIRGRLAYRMLQSIAVLKRVPSRR
jgi:hypothetical protein